MNEFICYECNGRTFSSLKQAEIHENSTEHVVVEQERVAW